MIFNKFPHFKQVNRNDCASVCLKIISKYHGRDIDTAYLRQLCDGDRHGSSVESVIDTAEHIGLKAVSLSVTFEQFSSRIPLPCIAHVNNNHYVVVYKITRSHIFVSNPSSTRRKYRHSEFRNRLFPFGATKCSIVCLEPQPKFFNDINENGGTDGKNPYFNTVLRYLLKYKKYLLRLLIVLLLISAIQMATPFVYRAMLDVGVDKKDELFINLMLIFQFSLIVFLAIANNFKEWITKHIGNRLNISIVSNYLVRVLEMPLPYFSKVTSGDIFGKVRDNERIKNFIMTHVVGLVFSFAMITTFCFVLYLFNPTVFYTYIIVTGIYVTFLLMFKKFQEKQEWDTNLLLSKKHNFWNEAVSNITDIKLNAYEVKFRAKWESIQSSIHYQDIKNQRLKNIQNFVSQVLNGCKNILITVICAKAVIAGEMSFGMMVSIQFIVAFLVSPINQFVIFFQNYANTKASFKKLTEFYKEHKDTDELTLNCRSINDGDIHLDRISFRYSPASKVILRNINVLLPFGGITAVVGRSGSGKSTLLKILLGLLSPSDGSVRVGNSLLSANTMGTWRAKCAAVLQDSSIFNDSFVNNIVLNEDKLDFSRLEEVIEDVQLKEVLRDLPNGYNTPISSGSGQLSKGEQQRVLIARALFRNPQVLILDEATSALDSLTEKRILDNLVQKYKNLTLIVATHRISLLHSADKILVMRNGRIEQEGTHHDLLNRPGLYSTLFESGVPKVEVGQAVESTLI